MSWEEMKKQFLKKQGKSEDDFSLSVCECAHSKYHHEATEGKCSYCNCLKYKEININ